jgi:hypothetical protein
MDMTPIIKRIAAGKRTPKDQIRLRERPSFPTSQANGLLRFAKSRGLSHQPMLTKAQQEDEAEIMSVALNQPHRRGLPNAPVDSDFWISELGKFCRLWHDFSADDPSAYCESTAYLRYRAGEAFARVIDDDLIAAGLRPRQRGDAQYDGVLSDADLRKRREKCARIRAEAEDVARNADRRGSLPMAVWAATRLCFEDRPLPEHLHEMMVGVLFELAVFFGIEKRPYHDKMW